MRMDVKQTPRIIREKVPERNTTSFVWLVFAFHLGVFTTKLLEKIGILSCFGSS